MPDRATDVPPPQGILRRIARELSGFAALEALGGVAAAGSMFALSRLLAANDFGVYAIGSFFVGLGGLLGDEGLAAALLLKREDVTEEECEVAATFLLVLAVAMAVLFLACSSLIARRYHLTQGEPWMVRAMAPLFLVVPLRAVPYLRMQRALRLSEIARVELAAGVARHLSAIALAWLTRNAWALVGAHAAGAAVQLLLAWRAAPGVTRLSLRWGTLRPLLSYGLKVQSLSIAAYFKDNISAMYLGAVMGPAAVGVFDFGVSYAAIPVVLVNKLSRAQLSVYSRFEAKDPELYNAVTAATRISLLAGLALLVALAVGATAIIPAAYSARWLVSVPVVYGLLANMAGGLLAGPLFALLQAQGRAGLAVRLFVVWTVSTWCLVLAVHNEGLGAVAWAHSVMTVATVFWLVRWAERHLGRPLVEGYGGACAAALGALAGVWGAGRAPALATYLKSGWVAAGVALALYAALLVAFERGRPLRELAQLVRAVRAGPAT